MEADLKREKQRSRAPKKRRVLTQSAQVYTEEIRRIFKVERTTKPKPRDAKKARTPNEKLIDLLQAKVKATD